MKGADLNGVTATVPPAAGNGTHRAAKRNGAASKRSAESDALPAPAPAAELFETIETQPIDSPMWPLHPAVWFQPEIAPSIPAWSSLTIERRHRIPAPDFLCSDPTPPDRACGMENSCAPVTPEARLDLPQSDLEPLGWDPRAVCRKQEVE